MPPIGKITPTTTLGDLELKLRAFGLRCFAMPEPDGRWYVLVGDTSEKHEINGSAHGGTLDEAIDSALNVYQQNKFGPQPKKEHLS